MTKQHQPSEECCNIYVGADRSQMLAFEVLKHSITRHAGMNVEVRAIDNTMVPSCDNVLFAPYTNFSFARFGIPKFNNYQGRAIYLDADMLVFKDIAELWKMPMDSAKLLLQAAPSERELALQSKKTIQNAVLLMDCGRLTWDPDRIIGDLGIKYDNKQLMSFEFMNDKDVMKSVPTSWNALDWCDAHTSLLHYTTVETQPWVFPKHPYGEQWLDELRLMIENKSLSKDFISREIALGYVRPSLLIELNLDDDYKGRAYSKDMLLDIDNKLNFVMHKEMLERASARKAAQVAYKNRFSYSKRRFFSSLLKRSFRFLRKKFQHTSVK